jgi:hypothetical protein
MAPRIEFIKVMKTVNIYWKTSSRVGGAHPAYGSSCFRHKPWKEWAAIEDALVKEKNIRYQK